MVHVCFNWCLVSLHLLSPIYKINLTDKLGSYTIQYHLPLFADLLQDCERKSFYTLCLVASNDNGSPPLSSSATVSITVTDVNDNMPVLFGDCSATISELEKPGGIITLYANDSDCNQVLRT